MIAGGFRQPGFADRQRVPGAQSLERVIVRRHGHQLDGSVGPLGTAEHELELRCIRRGKVAGAERNVTPKSRSRAGCELQDPKVRMGRQRSVWPGTNLGDMPGEEGPQVVVHEAGSAAVGRRRDLVLDRRDGRHCGPARVAVERVRNDSIARPSAGSEQHHDPSCQVGNLHGDEPQRTARRQLYRMRGDRPCRCHSFRFRPRRAPQCGQ